MDAQTDHISWAERRAGRESQALMIYFCFCTVGSRNLPLQRNKKYHFKKARPRLLIRALIQDLNKRFTEYKLNMATPSVLAVALPIWELTEAACSCCHLNLFFVDFCSPCAYVTRVFYDSASYPCVNGTVSGFCARRREGIGENSPSCDVEKKVISLYFLFLFFD